MADNDRPSLMLTTRERSDSVAPRSTKLANRQCPSAFSDEHAHRHDASAVKRAAHLGVRAGPSYPSAVGTLQEAGTVVRPSPLGAVDDR